MPPENANEQALASVYREDFTGLTTATVTLTYPVLRTVNDVGVEQVFRNGKLLSATAASASTSATTIHRERRTGSTSATWVLSATPDAGTEQVVKNGVVLDPSVDYSIATATITLASAPGAGDVLLAWYPSSASSSSSAGTSYTIDQNILTLDSALVSTDVLVVHYRYRN